MKFNIAAKLGLMASAVVLCITVLVGLLSRQTAEKILVEHEVSALAEETELRVHKLINDFRYLRKDVRELANPPRSRRGSVLNTASTVQALLDKPRMASQPERQALEKEFAELLRHEGNGHYLELCCISARGPNHPTLAAVGRTHAGAPLKATDGELARTNKKALKELLADPRSGKKDLFPVHAVRQGDTTTPMLLTVAFAVSPRAEGDVLALLLLTVDFEEFIRARTRHLPRYLLYLTDDAGRLLIHPDPATQQAIRRASAGRGGDWPTAAQDPALQAFAGHYKDKKKAGSQQLFRRHRGDERNPVELTGVAFYHVTQPFPDQPERDWLTDNWKKLDDMLAERAEADHQLRYSILPAYPWELRLSHPDRAELAKVRDAVTEREKEWGLARPPAWERDVTCDTFALRFMLLNPDLDARDSDILPDAQKEEEPRFFGLAMAVAIQEVEHDIATATNSLWWVLVLLSAAAAGIAWLASRVLTRPLKRITHAAGHVAAGDYSISLPTKRRDEIGVLARSFEDMLGQIIKRRDALYENIARTKAILDTAAEGIVTFDEHGVIEGFNQAAETIFGYRASEVNGQKVDLLMNVPYKGAETLASAGATDSVRMVKQVVRTHGEVVGRRKDGSTFPMEVAFSEVPLGGRRLVTGIFRDITERRRAEQEIRRMNEELESRVRVRTLELEEAMAKLEAALQGAMEATKAKDAFLASMSHELRTPLTTIIGYVQELYEDGFTDTEELSDRLQIILGAAQHLLDLINDILDLAKIASGRMQLSLEEFELAPLLETVRGLGRTLAQRNGNELTFEVAPNLGRMRADPKRVRQVLLNLLSNACKFTDHGRVVVRAWRAPDGGGDRIVLQVQDSGMGMTPEQARRLGERFYQVDQTNTKKKGGTGLGMAITKDLCHMMGGTFEVQSELGHGSTFTVRLPVRVEQPDPKKMNHGAHGEHGDKTTDEIVQSSSPVLPVSPVVHSSGRDLVLVVDDDPNVRDLLTRFLAKEGLRVYCAESSTRAVELARQLRPLAITLDVLMPELDGWTVLAALKTDPVTADIPVIMLTIEDNPARGFTLGASDYLTKPIDWPRLATVLHKYARASGGGPVLVVEDNPENRRLVCRLLQREGRAAVEAENGRVALQRLNEGVRPALILLDLMMPEMDGFQFLEEFRKRPEYGTVPVVVVTAKELSDEDRRRLNGSVTQILGKTALSQDQLLEHLRSYVQRHVTTPSPVG
jgi:PAS domain S-box-containing protein